ncbi:hypothetical protein DPEC_G00040820 [Dallia pectoralis]|uniref:Uncharacterized protein n=1 Tax=Dallia pectoralis TaxID=75939 RepID=A0ACC2HFL3_DALPE|nr:hypothetical protein DPEC_G00040820 [Dallia pectoralis]
MKLSVLLTVLIRTAHTDLDIRTIGDSHGFIIPKEVDSCSIYKQGAKRNVLLWSLSDPSKGFHLAGMSTDRMELNPYKNQYLLKIKVGEEAVLPCFNSDDPNGTETTWFTGGFKNQLISWDSSLLTRGGNQMYVSDGRTSGNYSLVIPSLMLNHTGWFDCYNSSRSREEMLIKAYELLVCPKSEPLTEFFSEGEEVVLRCNSNITESVRVVWYRKTGHVDDVIMDTRRKNLANYPEDLLGRMNASNPAYYLVLSNLSLADSGEYWCAVLYRGVCVSVTKTVLVEWDPFGINSTFYRVYSSLMACALLGMVCVLITVNLKTRRRDQEDSSPETETEEQQSGRGGRRRG